MNSEMIISVTTNSSFLGRVLLKQQNYVFRVKTLKTNSIYIAGQIENTILARQVLRVSSTRCHL